jgi:hypothetical protein
MCTSNVRHHAHRPDAVCPNKCQPELALSGDLAGVADLPLQEAGMFLGVEPARAPERNYAPV